MNKNKGFTLVELLVAITILGILSLLSLPIINQVNQRNQNSKYSKYAETMISSAKLYVDSYDLDLFGYDEKGCVDIPIEELKKKRLLKDIQIKDVTCTNPEGNKFTYIKVKKIKGKYEYQESIKCVDNKGTVVFEKKIDEPICESTTNQGPVMTTIPNTAPNTEITSGSTPIKIKITDEDDGLANNNYIHYGWTTTNDINTIKKGDWHRLDFGNPKAAKTTEKNITIFPTDQNEKTYYLYIKPTYVQDVSSNYVTKPIVLGPFKFNNNPQNYPKITMTAYKRDPNTGKNLGAAVGTVTVDETSKSKTLEPTIWFNSTTGGVNLVISADSNGASPIKSIIWMNNAPGKTKFENAVALSMETRTLIDGKDNLSVTEDGFRQGIYKVENQNGNITSIDVKFKIDKTEPTLKLTAYKKHVDTGKNNGEIINVTADSTTNEKTMQPDMWINKKTGGVNLDAVVSDKISGIASGTFKYDKAGATAFSNSRSLPNGGANRTITKGKDSVSLESSGYRHGVYTIKDKAGNTSSVKVRIKIDRTSPAKPTGLSNSSKGKCTTKNITVKAKSSDEMSGIQKWQYKFGSDGTWNDEADGTQFSIKLTKNRTKTMYIRAVDNAGNVSSNVTTKINKKKKCNSWPNNSCQIRGNKKRSSGTAWTCNGHHHSVTTYYQGYCSDSKGNLSKAFWVCTKAPYGEKDGWTVIND